VVQPIEGRNMSDTEANKKVIREYVEHFNAGDIAGLRKVCAPDAEIRGGKIARRWGVRDAASQAVQLGWSEPPKQA
jgi:ketosteroid isomerase-like protein